MTKALLFLPICICASGQVTTSQYDNARTGATLHETVLTPKNVNPSRFGRLFRLSVDGDVYAEPLYLPAVETPGHGKKNLLFVATEHDTVFAFDADQPSAPLWKTSLLNPDAKSEPVPAVDSRCFFIRPEIGVTSTPVIDYQSGTLYVLARTKEGRGLSSVYVQRLHALAVTTGVEKFGGPVIIKASVPGRGVGGANAQVAFDPLRENPRAALLLVHGQVILTWGSSCDAGPYHGWVMAYDAHTLTQTAVFNTSPDAEEGGIWLSDTGPAADKEGNIYVPTGNGKYDATPVGRNYGDSFLKLAVEGRSLNLRDYFTPSNQYELDSQDWDLGSGGPLLLPDQPGQHPHLAVVGGKGSTIYLIDRDNMGKYQPMDRHALQKIPTSGGVMGATAYWNQHVYVIASGSAVKDYALTRGLLSANVRSNRMFTDPGATPSISANGNKDGILWALSTKGWRSRDQSAVLYAFDASNVTTELYNSEQNSAPDRAGLALRFVIPMVANGKVYVGVRGAVEVYGLRNAGTF